MSKKAVFRRKISRSTKSGIFSFLHSIWRKIILGWSRSRSQSSRMRSTHSPGSNPVDGKSHRVVVTTGKFNVSSWWPPLITWWLLVTVWLVWWCMWGTWCGWRWWWEVVEAWTDVEEDWEEGVEVPLLLLSLFSFFIRCLRWTWKK